MLSAKKARAGRMAPHLRNRIGCTGASKLTAISYKRKAPANSAYAPTSRPRLPRGLQFRNLS
jgi:hypothetical protein